MKNCTSCKLVKYESEFYKDASRKDGFSNRCRECDKKQHKKHVDEHPEYREKQLERIVKWSESNKDIVRESKKKWREENRERINAIQREWRKNNPDKVIAQRLRDSLKNNEVLHETV